MSKEIMIEINTDVKGKINAQKICSLPAEKGASLFSIFVLLSLGHIQKGALAETSGKAPGPLLYFLFSCFSSRGNPGSVLDNDISTSTVATVLSLFNLKNTSHFCPRSGIPLSGTNVITDWSQCCNKKARSSCIPKLHLTSDSPLGRKHPQAVEK
jgi:hypothetical protein